MEEIAVLKACLVRPTVNHPWGFRLKGGADIGQPIGINAVLAGSPAAAIGLVADDEVTEIEGQPTANMTHSQALEAIARHARLTGETLYLTVERKARTSVPQGPEDGQTHVSPKTYEPLDNVSESHGRTTKVLPDVTPVFQPIHGNPGNNVISSSPSPFATSEPETGRDGFYTAARNQRRSLEPPYSPREPAYNVPHGSGTLPHQVGSPPGNSSYYPPGPSRTPFEFQKVQSRPFVEPVSHRRPHNHPSSQAVTAPLPPTPPPEALLPVDTGGGFEEVSLRSDYSTQLRNDMNEVPQSRTFKILESIMSNEEPSAGASGLPPPRSAAMERMKREGSTAGSSARVKILMSQKYNSPLGMYSAKNLIETFAVQAENAIETLEKQNPALPEHEPVYASRH